MLNTKTAPTWPPCLRLRHHSSILNATPECLTKAKPSQGISPAFCSMQIRSAHLHTIATSARLGGSPLHTSVNIARNGDQLSDPGWPNPDNFEQWEIPAPHYKCMRVHLPELHTMHRMVDETFTTAGQKTQACNALVIM